MFALAIQEGGREVWSARDLMPYLGYKRWDRVPEVIDRARVACQNSGHNAADHFRASSKMMAIKKTMPRGSSDHRGSIENREVEDFHLTRYAAYLVAMNGDPRKPEIAAAQTYFAVKTREAETAEPPVLRLEAAQDPILASLEMQQKMGAAIIQMRQEQIVIESKVNSLHLRVQAVEDRQHEAAESMLALPEPTEEAPELTEAAKCRLAVDSLVELTGRGHHDIWKEVYKQYDARCRTKLTTLVDNFNEGKRPKDKLSKLEYIARFGKVGVLYSIILIFVERAQPFSA